MGERSDLGRRLARRREDIGLSRKELAERTEMDPGYLAYLEERAAHPGGDTLRRLATALATSVDDLLGCRADSPPGHTGGESAGVAVLDKLDVRECLRLISPGGVGRVGFNDQDGPSVLPVNYVLHEEAVYFRTALGGPLDRGLRTGVEGLEFKVAFEVDRIDDVNREGWSVLVRGGAHLVTDSEREAVLGLGVRPWAGGDRQLFVKVTHTQITGRRIRVEL
ncbi:helix-turn-helix domain-containing protein [Sinosporangium siamense]|uniref:HTH cro/C1-type domain-containing protein n=1 Tax=Sinosporangium siamense TaxID=1367973 RepID=A0A919RPH0_9ACTN|nr:pyridoxamine 5'-phosphate oxidase family protein [Sinosporangium siamense]GII96011.1 hypothetical protein Ssi02_62420 [Sinosporangium siamense]